MSGHPKGACVRTPVPGPRASELLALREKYVPGGVFNVVPTFVEKAEGALITDVDGNSFIDFASGIGVLNVGSTPAPVVGAVREQAAKFLHTCFHVAMYEPYVRLAEVLCHLVPGDAPKKALLVNSGAEAVENAIKIARRYTGKTAIITFENAFHGRTLLAMSLTSKVNPYKLGFGPFAPDVYRLPFAYCYRCSLGLTHPGCKTACLDLLDRMLNVDIGPDNVAAMIVEPVQGEGGFIVPPTEFVRGLKAMAENYGFLFIADEVQSGLGRTGKMFAIEHHGVVPDMVVLAKALAAGLPLSAVVGRTEIMEAVHVGGIGGTYAGNPVSCAAGLKVIELLTKQDLPQRAARIGQVMQARFGKLRVDCEQVGDARGLGAMMAIEFVKNRNTKEPAREISAAVIKECYQNGLITMKAGILDNVVRCLPPLVIEDELLEEGLTIFEKAVARICG